MRAASLAKLGLRMIAVYLALLVLPGRIELTASMAIAQIGQGFSNDNAMANTTIACVQAVFMVIMAAILWSRSDNIVNVLLPAGASLEPEIGYARWQSLGLMFVGGLLVFKALIYLPYWLSHGGSGLFLIIFNVVAAIILIGDGHVLLGVLSRLRHTDWIAVLKTRRGQL